jgi:hypothetical protein
VLSLPAVAALLDTGVQEGQRLAELLVDLSLLCSLGQQRYRLRDLQYLYAREELYRADAAERVNAVRRLTAHYLSMLRAASPASREALHDDVVALIADNSGRALSNPDAVSRLRRYLTPRAGIGPEHLAPTPLRRPPAPPATPGAVLMSPLRAPH